MRNILVGTDLTANSENAFIRAIRLARLTGAKLHVLHVNRGLQVPGTEGEASALQSQLRDRIDKLVQAQSPRSGIDYDIHLEARGRTYEVVDQYAGSTRADLVIVGRSKRPGVIPSSVFLTTGQVVAMSDYPVLVVTQPVSKGYGRILLEADFSRSSERALTIVSSFGPDVALTIVQSSNDDPAPRGFLKRLRAKARKRKHEALVARAASMLQQHGRQDERLSFEAVERDPIDALLAALTESKFDVVVFTDVRRKLRSSELRDRFLSAAPVASCDILFDPA